jgi:8-oxo-dGTP diphosphatase
MHLRTLDAARLRRRPDLPAKALLGVSAHHHPQVIHAREIGADFAVLGPVLATPSHPNQPPLGWAGFVQGNRDAGIPVFALGGQSWSTLTAAQAQGAQGIAAIRGLI